MRGCSALTVCRGPKPSKNNRIPKVEAIERITLPPILSQRESLAMSVLLVNTTPSKQKQDSGSNAENGDVWIELFGTVKSLEEAVDLCMQAFGPDPADKVGNDMKETTHFLHSP